jgi:outer membrane immunogenic protein
VRSFVALLLLLAFGPGVASAADLPLPEPSRPATFYDEKGPYTNWAGAYLGLNGGYALGSSQWTMGGLGTDVFNTSGFVFGGTAGFNIPVSAVLVGLEGDLDWSGLSASTVNCAVNSSGATAACQTKSNLLGTVRARMGYAFDRTLIYVTGGAAFRARPPRIVEPPPALRSRSPRMWCAAVSTIDSPGEQARRS